MSSVDALVIACMDSRLHRVDRPYLGEHLQGKYVGVKTWDLATAPGGAHAIVSGGSGKEALLHAVKFAHEKHGVTRIFLVSHSDCAAYGGVGAFPDATEEYRKHALDLRAARDVLRQTIPNLDIRLFFASVEDRKEGPFVTFDDVR